MPIFGMNNGLTPILSYNYGARNQRRIADGIRFALAAALCIMGVGMVIFLLFPQLLMGIFSAPELAMTMGVPALRIVSLSFLFAGVSIILGAAFQALGAPMFSLIISLLRQLVIVLPVCLLLALPPRSWCGGASPGRGCFLPRGAGVLPEDLPGEDLRAGVRRN